jgi:hypothetical protein
MVMTCSPPFRTCARLRSRSAVTAIQGCLFAAIGAEIRFAAQTARWRADERGLPASILRLSARDRPGRLGVSTASNQAELVRAAARGSVYRAPPQAPSPDGRLVDRNNGRVALDPDGYRMIVCRGGPTVRLYSRNAYDWTARL